MDQGDQSDEWEGTERRQGERRTGKERRGDERVEWERRSGEDRRGHPLYSRRKKKDSPEPEQSAV